MKSGREDYDQSLLDSLEKKYQLFLDSPNGEINVFLVLNKTEEDKSEISSKNLNHMSMNMNMNMNYSKSSPLSSNILQPNRSYKNMPKNYDNSSLNHSHDLMNSNLI